MRVYTKVTINMRTLGIVNEESFDYVGPVAECKGGSGGGGGGGSGRVSYPTYMETIHSTWLSDTDGYMDAAIGNSPYTTAVAYDPDTDITAMETAITAFNAVLDNIDVNNYYVSYSNAVKNQVDDNIISTTIIDADIAAHAAVINVDYDDDVTKLQSGMRDIGAAMTSSFVIGQADLYAKKERSLTEFGTRLYVEVERQRNEMVVAHVNTLFTTHMQRTALEGDVARLVADTKRIKIVAKGEEARENYEYDEMDAKWDLEMTNYGAAVLAAIGGGVVTSDSGKMSKTQSALSGALSGAAMGAQAGIAFGNPALGAGIGAVLGLAGGLF